MKYCPALFFSTLQGCSTHSDQSGYGLTDFHQLWYFSQFWVEKTCIVPLLSRGKWSCHTARLGNWTKSVKHNGDKFDIVS